MLIILRITNSKKKINIFFEFGGDSKSETPDILLICDNDTTIEDMFNRYLIELRNKGYSGYTLNDFSFYYECHVINVVDYRYKLIREVFKGNALIIIQVLNNKLVTG